MRRLLLATTAISALALGTPLALAQSSTAPSGALEEQKQPPDKSGKTANPTMPGQGMHNGSPPAGRSAQAPEASPNPTKRSTGQAQVEPNAQPPKGQPRTHQAQQEQPSPQQPKAQERLNGQARPQTPSATGEINNAPRNAGSDQRPATTRTDQGNRSPAAGTTGGRGQVQVSEQQRTQIHERIGHLRTQRLNRADFSLEVGAAVPWSVRLYTLPPEIVEIVPEYRGYDYVMVGDDIVIIDPDSHEIVAVIPA
jgi:uncharacterized protein DUF1236